MVQKLQQKSESKRFSKSHLIDEIKKLRDDYNRFINEFLNGKLKPKYIFVYLKLKNIENQEIIRILRAKKYKLENNRFESYHTELIKTIDKTIELSENYKANKVIEPGSVYKNKILRFKQKNNTIFNDFILIVNG